MRMADLLIRGISDDVVSLVDGRARRLGLSRNEYLRRKLAQEVATDEGDVSLSALAEFAETFADLADEAVMSQAWE
jgi:hypothetical protein